MRDGDDPALALALDRAWDEVARGGPAGSPERHLDPTLDPGLAATVRRVHELDEAPPADPAFAARLWEDLMHADGLASAPPPRSRPDRSPAGIVTRPPVRLPVPIAPVSPGRRPLAWLATAALLLLTLGAGYLAFGPGRPVADRPEGIPAIAASPSPPPTTPAATPGEDTLATASAAGDDLLLEMTIAADAVPGEGTEFGWLSFGTIAPGFVGEVPFAPEVCCPGVYIDYVVDGSYRLRVDQPFQVRPAAEPGRWIEQPAGTEVTLGPGDAVAYRLPSGYAITNLGVTPVHVVSAGLVSGSLSSVQIEQPVMTHLSDIFPEPAAELGAVELTLRREALAAEGTLPAPSEGGYQATVGGPGNPELGQRSDGSVKNLRDEARPVYVLTLRPTAGQDDAGSA